MPMRTHCPSYRKCTPDTGLRSLGQRITFHWKGYLPKNCSHVFPNDPLAELLHSFKYRSSAGISSLLLFHARKLSSQFTELTMHLEPTNPCLYAMGKETSSTTVFTAKHTGKTGKCPSRVNNCYYHQDLYSR